MSLILQISSDAINTGAENLLKLSGKMAWRLAIDLCTLYVLLRLIYLRIYKQRDYFFMFVIFNLVIFIVSFLLNKVELSLGAAFGLFAVFSMLRYRAENISIKDMTYLFLCIALGLVSAVTKIKGTPDVYEYLFIGGLNTVVLLIVFLLESSRFFPKEQSKYIVYERPELLRPEKRGDLIADLKQRTGLDIQRLHIEKIDYIKDSALLKVYYYGEA